MNNESYLHSNCEGHTGEDADKDKNSDIDPCTYTVKFSLS